MTTSTEVAERLAATYVSGARSIVATALRSLAAERDALRAERNAERSARFKAEVEFSHMQRRIARQRRALAKLYQRRHYRKAENARLREALRLAIENVEFWAAYATSYFQDKHDLAGDLQKLRVALGEKE